MTHDLLQFIQRTQKISVDYLENNEIMTTDQNNEKMTHLTAC